jgi:hypothetical protein
MYLVVEPFHGAYVMGVCLRDGRAPIGGHRMGTYL